MSPSTRPVVLVIDDQRSDGMALKRLVGPNAEVVVRTPDEFTESDLRGADLVLVDYELDDWSGARASLAAPPNGLALSAVVREQINNSVGKVTGVALYSGRVRSISGTLPEELRGFAVARLCNLEWVFEKNSEQAPAGVVSLARAIRQLPPQWPEEAAEATRSLHALLGLAPNAPFFATAADDISACHPPIHELSTATHALAVIRWMAHRILPYPAFLTDLIGMAARLRIEVAELERLLRGKSKLARELDSVRYKGILCDLYGPHWWRSGLDDLVFQWTDGTGGVDALHRAVNRLAARKVKFLAHEVVPAIDESYRANELVEVNDALRVQLDDWPPYADDAWAERELVLDSERLRGLVVASDAELLGDDD
ncbi:MAG TPA: hypothetical protein VHT29_02830 [Solirubrobacteraceae bacterium]|jgi:hypothetical protein|nr:hypothetical protein [Solirubrobacteraceae bacterium]